VRLPDGLTPSAQWLAASCGASAAVVPPEGRAHRGRGMGKGVVIAAWAGLRVLRVRWERVGPTCQRCLPEQEGFVRHVEAERHIEVVLMSSV
jgi:hypothetical protein